MQGVCDIYGKTESFHNFFEIFLSVKPHLPADTFQQDGECRRARALLCAAPHLFVVKESDNAYPLPVPRVERINTCLDRGEVVKARRGEKSIVTSQETAALIGIGIQIIGENILRRNTEFLREQNEQFLRIILITVAILEE